MAFVAELTSEGAKSICTAHPHLLVGVVPLQERHLTQLCGAAARCINVRLQCSISCHINCLGLFLPLHLSHGYWKLCLLPVCLEGGREGWRVSVLSQLQQSRCRCQAAARCHSSVLPVPASAGVSVSEGINPGSLGSSLPGG